MSVNRWMDKEDVVYICTMEYYWKKSVQKAMKYKAENNTENIWTKSWFVEKINNIDKPQETRGKPKINNMRNGRGNFTTDDTNMRKIKKE